jgi:hypothetical protein
MSATIIFSGNTYTVTYSNSYTLTFNSNFTLPPPNGAIYQKTFSSTMNSVYPLSVICECPTSYYTSSSSSGDGLINVTIETNSGEEFLSFENISVSCSSATGSFTGQNTNTQGTTSTSLNFAITSNVKVSCPSSSDKFLTYTNSNNVKTIETTYTFTDTNYNSFIIQQTSRNINSEAYPTLITITNNGFSNTNARIAIASLINTIFGLYCIATINGKSQVKNGTGVTINVLGGFCAFFYQ